MWSKPTTAGDANKKAGTPAGASPLAPHQIKQKNPGRRFAQIVKLKPEFVERYVEEHQRVWPEVLKQIKNCNIQDYSIFHDPDTHVLFATFKYVGYDFEGDMERMRDNPRVREWWRMTDGWQESMNEGAVSSETSGRDGIPPWWRSVKEVFYTP